MEMNFLEFYMLLEEWWQRVKTIFRPNEGFMLQVAVVIWFILLVFEARCQVSLVCVLKIHSLLKGCCMAQVPRASPPLSIRLAPGLCPRVLFRNKNLGQLSDF